MRNHITKLVRVAASPVTVVVDTCHHLPKARIFKTKKQANVAVGIVLMFTGAALAPHPIGFVPHVVWECVCFFVHGYGALPVAKIMCEKWRVLDLENFEDVCEKEVKKEIKAVEDEIKKFEHNL